MINPDKLARGNKPHSAASISGLANSISRKFEQELSRMVESVGREELTHMSFHVLISGLRGLLAGVGRDAIEQILQAKDKELASVEVAGERLRYRGISAAEWLTPFGRITLLRRTYRADGAGKRSAVPLDDACGMRGRFMTPDVEEMAAFGMAMLTAPEVEQLLAKALPEGPSSTAIQNVAHRLGAAIEEQRSAIEDAIAEGQPLSSKGDVLVASWDGVMTPMREAGVAWREAGVAAVSVYGMGKHGPEKRDTRFLARMPESGMVTLVASVADQVARATRQHSFREVVVICDGKETIWSAAATQPALLDAVWILDFYHASENLMKAANALFGDGPEAGRWHQKHRDKLQLDKTGVDHVMRSMRRYRRLMPEGAQRNVLDNAIKYFRFHRARMRYADFIARGLPIGSGPVESAAKNIVQARLKRSGMRWSRDGGQHVLDLRAFLKSGRWESMWNTLMRAA